MAAESDEEGCWETVVSMRKRGGGFSLPGGGEGDSSAAKQQLQQQKVQEEKLAKAMVAEDAPTPLVSSTVAKAVMLARTGRKLTQQQLATACNMQVQDVKEIESGKAVLSKEIRAKIVRLKKVLQLGRDMC